MSYSPDPGGPIHARPAGDEPEHLRAVTWHLERTGTEVTDHRLSARLVVAAVDAAVHDVVLTEPPGPRRATADEVVAIITDGLDAPSGPSLNRRTIAATNIGSCPHEPTGPSFSPTLPTVETVTHRPIRSERRSRRTLRVHHAERSSRRRICWPSAGIFWWPLTPTGDLFGLGSRLRGVNAD